MSGLTPKRISLIVFLLLILMPVHALAQCGLGTATGTCGVGTAGAWKIFYSVMCRVQFYLTTAILTMYQQVANAAQKPVKVMATVYIIFYCMAFMFGFIEATKGEFITRLIKVLLVMLFATKPCFFFEYMYKFFMSAMNTLALLALGNSAIGTGATAQEVLHNSSVFGSFDIAFNAIVGPQGVTLLLILIVAFLLTGGGTILSLMLSIGGITVFYAFLRLFITFAIAIISLTFTMMFTPIFMIFLLFSETRDLFYNWLGLLVSYALQPPIIMFYMIIMGSILNISFITDRLSGGVNPNINPCTVNNIPIPPGAIMVPFCYRINLAIMSWGFPFYALRPGLTMTTPIDFTLNAGLPVVQNGIVTITPGAQVVWMPVFAAIASFIFIWLIMSWASLRFAQFVPELAQRISVLAQAPIVPVIGGVQGSPGSGGSPRGSEMIVPGMTPGAGMGLFDGAGEAITGAGDWVGKNFIRDPAKNTAARVFKPITSVIDWMKK